MVLESRLPSTTEPSISPQAKSFGESLTWRLPSLKLAKTQWVFESLSRASEKSPHSWLRHGEFPKTVIFRGALSETYFLGGSPFWTFGPWVNRWVQWIVVFGVLLFTNPRSWTLKPLSNLLKPCSIYGARNRRNLGLFPYFHANLIFWESFSCDPWFLIIVFHAHLKFNYAVLCAR